MLEAGAETASEMGYYESPKEKVQIGPFRVHPDRRRGLEALMIFWRFEAPAKGDDPKKIDLTHVADRLVAVGLDGAFEEILRELGLEQMPVTDSQWVRFEAALQSRMQEALDAADLDHLPRTKEELQRFADAARKIAGRVKLSK